MVQIDDEWFYVKNYVENVERDFFIQRLVSEEIKFENGSGILRLG